MTRMSPRRSYPPRIAIAVAMAMLMAGCGSSPEAGPTEPTSKVDAGTTAPSFPTAAFADIREDPVSEEVAAEFQAILSDMAGGAGMAATVMSADGTWSGAAGKADGVRDVRIDDQFAIASVTKSVVAAQVMQMVEAGELALDDPAADHLPPDLDFDTNGATIRHLLGQRSGIPDYYPRRCGRAVNRSATGLDAGRSPGAGQPPIALPPVRSFVYTDTNYLLLGLVIEQVRGRPVGRCAARRRPQHRRGRAAHLSTGRGPDRAHGDA